MSLTDLADWLNEQTGPDRVWFIKRLSANDTGQTGGHQVGFYVPKPLMFGLFPGLDIQPPPENLDSFFTLYVDSHDQRADARVIWYCNKYWQVPQPGNPRDEMRVTRLGGTAYQDPDNTGALMLVSFERSAGGTKVARAWVCRNPPEEDLIEERTRPVEPGRYLVWEPAEARQPDLFEQPVRRENCFLEAHELPVAWQETYPTGADIVARTVEMRADTGLPPDKRLIQRRQCEYELFLSIEKAIELPVIRRGFADIDAFVRHAQTVLQRRKSRSGRSLELHARAILLEEGFEEGRDFDWQAKTERNNTPDFLFPNAGAYHDANFPAGRLRMLAAKTTCKDRWRQIAKEADRIGTKHLLTLQEGVSESQFQQMQNEGVQLVVPTALVKKYPKAVQTHLITLDGFMRALQPPPA